MSYEIVTEHIKNDINGKLPDADPETVAHVVATWPPYFRTLSIPDGKPAVTEYESLIYMRVQAGALNGLFWAPDVNAVLGSDRDG